MVQFEVVQASLKRWDPLLKAEEAAGLYLEIYPETRDTEKRRFRCPRSCVCRCRKKPSVEQMHFLTDVVPESRHMQWRRYNEDGFLIALFSITGPTVSHARRGDSLNMVAELYKEPLEGVDDSSDVWMGTFHSRWSFGVWGQLRLRPSQDSIEDGLAESLELTLDLRPRQSRPFSLQNAKPYLERASIEELSAIVKRENGRFTRSYSDTSDIETRKSGILPRNASRTIKALYKGLVNLKRHQKDEENQSDRERPVGVTFSGVNEEAFWQSSYPLSEFHSKDYFLNSMSSANFPASPGFPASPWQCSPNFPTTPTSPWPVSPIRGVSGNSNSGSSVPVSNLGSSSARLNMVHCFSEASHRSLHFDDCTVSQIPSTLGLDTRTSASNTSSAGNGVESEAFGSRSRAASMSNACSSMSRKSKQRLSCDDSWYPGSMYQPSSRSSVRTRKSHVSWRSSVGARSNALTEHGNALTARTSLHTTVSRMSRASRASRDPFQKIAEKALRLRVPNFFSKPKNDIQLVHWVPQDWPQVWKKQWPIEADELHEGIEVTPIMEAEFRKDCLVFFNSMFPRVDGERFSLFRDLAFQRTSKLRFPLMRKLDRGWSTATFGSKGSLASGGQSSRLYRNWNKSTPLKGMDGSRGTGSDEDSDVDTVEDQDFETLSTADKSIPEDDVLSQYSVRRSRHRRRRFPWCCCRRGRRRFGNAKASSRSREMSSSTGSMVSHQTSASSSRRSLWGPRRSSTPEGGKIGRSSSIKTDITPFAETPPMEKSSIASSGATLGINYDWMDQFRVQDELVPSEREAIGVTDRLDHHDDPNGQKGSGISGEDGGNGGCEGDAVSSFQLRSGKRKKTNEETVFGVCCSSVAALDEIEVGAALDEIEVSVARQIGSVRQTIDQVERPIGDVTPISDAFQDLERDGADGSLRRVNGVAFRENCGLHNMDPLTEPSIPTSPDVSRATCKESYQTEASVVSGENLVDLDVHAALGASESLAVASTFSGHLHSVPSTQPSVTVQRSIRSDGAETLSSIDNSHRGRHSIASSIATDKSSIKQAACLSTVTINGSVFHDEYSPRVMVMKRLFLSFAICGVYYTEVANSPQLGELWPYPMATILGHGSRVLIRLEDVEGSAFLNFLLFGDPRISNWRESGIPPPLKPRIAATHSVQIETETGHLIERRLKLNTMDTLQNIADGIRKRHLGLNLPIGGVANPSAMGADHCIDFTGRLVRKVDPNLASKSASVVRFITGSNFLNGSRSINVDESIDESDDNPKSVKTRWTPLPKVQGGHLYIRLDEFGDHRSCWHSDVFSAESREDVIKELQTKSDRSVVELEHFKRKAQMENQSCAAGVLFFSNQVPTLKVKHRNGLNYVADNDILDDSEGRGLCLLRVSSDPCIHYSTIDAVPEDITWVNRMIKCRRHVPLTLPPSPEALEMLLRHYHPMKSQFFGTARHNSFNEFYKELVDQKSFLIKGGDSRLERVVEPLILRLQWRNCVLMLTHETKPDLDYPVHKRTYICARMKLGESWQMAARSALHKELDLRFEDVLQTLTPASLDMRTCHRIIEESAVSPSYPGLRTFYRTHHVEWSIREDSISFFSGHGLPPNLAKRETMTCNADFITEKETSTGVKTLYWRWVDIHVARGLQSFLNMGEANPDERWAKYAFQQNGIIHPPPSDVALGLLFKRCGIDTVEYNGENGHKTLTQLRFEALNQECHLIMNKGRLTRVAESVLVRLRCRKTDIGNRFNLDESKWIVLVRFAIEKDKKDKEDKHSPESTTELSPSRGKGEPNPKPKEAEVRKYTLLRGKKDREEAWQEAALTCVSRDLGLTKIQVKGLLEPGLKPGEASVSFYEERAESPSYPKLETLYKTHLVTLTVRHDILATSCQHLLFGDAEFGFRDTDVSRQTVATTTTPSRRKPTCILQEGPNLSQLVIHNESKEFQWMFEEIAKDLVDDVKLWEAVVTETCKVQSVLIGLEGTAPQCKSPFGTAHDIKGASSKVSVSGNRKWRAYRTNNALQIPASEGGMRVKIDGKKFEELVQTCEVLDLLDPKLELHCQRGQAYLPRSVKGRETLRPVGVNTWQVVENRTKEEIDADPFGRGLAYRRKKNLEAIMTSRQNLVTGATIEGYDEYDGWVRVLIKEAWNREVLDHRYAEKELFKQLLSGNGDEAKQAVSWMKEYRANHKSSSRVFKDISDFMEKRAPKEPSSPRRGKIIFHGDESTHSRQPWGDAVRRVCSRA